MPLYRKPRSPFWYYSISVEGVVHRASTRQTSRRAALVAESEARLAPRDGGLPPLERRPTLRALSIRFLEWVARSFELTQNTRPYYSYGWRLLSFSPLSDRRVDKITSDGIACTEFRRPSRKDPAIFEPCSITYMLQALRTLKVMLGKALEWDVIHKRPRVPMPKPVGRELLIDANTDRSIDAAYNDPIKNRSITRHRRRAWTPPALTVGRKGDWMRSVTISIQTQQIVVTVVDGDNTTVVIVPKSSLPTPSSPGDSSGAFGCAKP